METSLRNFRTARPGDKQISSSLLNAASDLIARQEAGSILGGTAPSIVRVVNNTGQALNYGDCVGIQSPLFDVPATPNTAQQPDNPDDEVEQLRHFNDRSYSAVLPTEGHSLGIITEPGDVGQVCRVTLSGVVRAVVDVKDTTHKSVTFTAETTDLESSDSGKASFFIQPTATGKQWCDLVLGTASSTNRHGIIAMKNVSGVTIPKFAAVIYNSMYNRPNYASLFNDFQTRYFDAGNVVPPTDQEMLDLFNELQAPLINDTSAGWVCNMMGAIDTSDHRTLRDRMPCGIAQAEIKPGESGPVMIDGVTPAFAVPGSEGWERHPASWPFCVGRNGTLRHSPMPYGNVLNASIYGIAGTEDNWQDFSGRFLSDDETITQEGTWFIVRVVPYVRIPQRLECEIQTDGADSDFFGYYSSAFAKVKVVYSFQGINNLEYKFKVPIIGRIKAADFAINKKFYLDYRDSGPAYGNYELGDPITNYPLAFVGRVTAVNTPNTTITVQTQEGESVTATNASGLTLAVNDTVIVTTTARTDTDLPSGQSRFVTSKI